MVSHQERLELLSQTALPLTAFLHTRFGRCTGISFVDAKPEPSVHEGLQSTVALQPDARKAFEGDHDAAPDVSGGLFCPVDGLEHASEKLSMIILT